MPLPYWYSDFGQWFWFIVSTFRAQFQENRSIFNTPNARIANASVMKGSIKYKKPQTQTSVVKRIECTDRGSIDKLDDTH